MLCAMFCAISFLQGMSIKLPERSCSSKAAKLKRPSAAHFTELDAMPYKGRTEIGELHAPKHAFAERALRKSKAFAAAEKFRVKVRAKLALPAGALRESPGTVLPQRP